MLPVELLKRIFYMEPLEHIDHLLSFMQLEDAIRLLAECNHYVNFDTNAEFLEVSDQFDRLLHLKWSYFVLSLFTIELRIVISCETEFRDERAFFFLLFPFL